MLMPSSTSTTVRGEKRSITGPRKMRAAAMIAVNSVSPRPPMKGGDWNTSRM